MIGAARGRPTGRCIATPPRCCPAGRCCWWFMVRKRRGSQQTTIQERTRRGARRCRSQADINGRSDDYVGGECERRWKAALKRRAMERNEAKIDDRDGLRSLHRDAVSVARGSARRDRGLVELKKAVSPARSPLRPQPRLPPFPTFKGAKSLRQRLFASDQSLMTLTPRWKRSAGAINRCR